MKDVARELGVLRAPEIEPCELAARLADGRVQERGRNVLLVRVGTQSMQSCRFARRRSGVHHEDRIDLNCAP